MPYTYNVKNNGKKKKRLRTNTSVIFSFWHVHFNAMSVEETFINASRLPEKKKTALRQPQKRNTAVSLKGSYNESAYLKVICLPYDITLHFL